MRRNIRSLTFGASEKDLQRGTFNNELKDFFKKANDLFSKNKINLYTSRISTEPLSINNEISDSYVNSFSNQVSNISNDLSLRWYCIPFEISSDSNIKNFDFAFNLLKNKSNAFVHFIFNKQAIISSLLLEYSKLNLKVSKISNNGFDNFRLGASFNVKSNTPFFPFSFSSNTSGFSFASDACDIFLNVINKYPNYNFSDLKNKIINEYSKYLILLNFIGHELENNTGFKFFGIDCSLAPFPNSNKSVARIIEVLGNSEFGSPGTLSIVSFITEIIRDTIKLSEIKSIGFNGVMLSVIEDDILSLRASQRNYDIYSLLLYCRLLLLRLLLHEETLS